MKQVLTIQLGDVKRAASRVALGGAILGRCTEVGQHARMVKGKDTEVSSGTDTFE